MGAGIWGTPSGASWPGCVGVGVAPPSPLASVFSVNGAPSKGWCACRWRQRRGVRRRGGGPDTLVTSTESRRRWTLCSRRAEAEPSRGGPSRGRGRGRHLGEVAPPRPLALPCAAAREREAVSLGSLPRPPAPTRCAEAWTVLHRLPGASWSPPASDPSLCAHLGPALGAGPQPPRPLAPGPAPRGE